MRLLSIIEKERLKALTEKSISVTLIQPTKTGLEKSIMDATGSVRNYLKEEKIHDFEIQKQGPNHKIIVRANLYDKVKAINSKASLYRPRTKKGDPRIWFSGLKKIAKPNDILAILFFENEFHILNLTQLDVVSILKSSIITPLKELIEEMSGIENLIANELLLKLKKIAKKGFIPSTANADTSVGRTLERLLGIQMNSSQSPDYNGIELKSFRKNKGNRKTLFAQVPNWNLSKFKSSAETLDAFGYDRSGVFKLNCTLSTKVRNSQGLKLKLDKNANWLIGNSDKKEFGDFEVWMLQKLRERLLTKHKETFWIAAKSKKKDGKEFFQYNEVEHTKRPIASQFDILIEQGIITVDHLIKRNAKGQASERGPLFKIKPNSLDLLFPPSLIYDLLE